MIQGESLIIGEEKTEQECFLHKLSAKIPLKDTNKLGDKNPLIFQDRSLELNQAEKSISLSLTSAFIQQLLCRYNLQDAKATSLPQEKLDQEASSCNINLDAHRTKLYRETVGALVWASMSRPDISFWAQNLAKSFAKPTENNERQLAKVLMYLKGTRHFSISLQPPRKLERAKSLELIAFSGAAWPEVGRAIMNVSLFLMGVPLATSTTTQATTPKATQLASVRLACRMAFQTKLLLQLRVVKPLSLRVLLGGPLAVQLGLSRKARHLELHSWFGQFQLSKVPQSNLAESLTYKLGTSGLYRLLPKLKMHARTAEELALHTELGLGEVASFESSSGSFFIGSLSQTPAMEQLCASPLCSEQLLDGKLLGKELGMPIDLPELQSTSSNESFRSISLQQDQLVAAYSQNGLHSQSLEIEELVPASSEDSLHSQSLATEELVEDSLYSQSLAIDELTAAYSKGSLQSLQPPTLNSSTRASKLHPLDGSTRALDQLVAFTSSLGASRKQLRASGFRILFSLIIVLVIFMIASLILHSFSLPLVLGIESLQCTMSFQQLVRTKPQNTTSSFPNLWGQELENQQEIRRTCWNSELEKKEAFMNLLWAIELANQLADKPFWDNQLQQNLSEIEKNKKPTRS